MSSGTDPHGYVPTAQNINKIQEADLIFYHGLHLEGKMVDLFAQQIKEGKNILAVSETLPVEKLIPVLESAASKESRVYDPHVWMDLSLWALVLDPVENYLVKLKPAIKEEFSRAKMDYLNQLQVLDRTIRQKLKEVPEKQRVLVTSHDAFSYFGRAYGLKVLPLQGISTVSELSLAKLQNVASEIKNNQIKVLFVESSVSPKTIERLSALTGAKIGAQLYSDSLGPRGQILKGFRVDTYLGMMSYNSTVIVEALTGGL